MKTDTTAFSSPEMEKYRRAGLICQGDESVIAPDTIPDDVRSYNRVFHQVYLNRFISKYSPLYLTLASPSPT